VEDFLPDSGAEESSRGYFCTACGVTSRRAFIVDDGIDWWRGGDGEVWHRTAGIFVRNDRDEFLLFARTRFPRGLTVPAGHVSAGESPAAAAVRELAEETGLHAETLQPIVTADMVGDSCRRGADRHVWHAYLHRAPEVPKVAISDEGFSPVWLALPEALELALIMPVRSLIETCAELLLAEPE
jgi:8-oxo-dGTP pyrophosphatase MutT (NUDIX family)